MIAPRRISLIMPARNEGAMARRTVDSLLANTHYPDWELLLLDDGSEDGCCGFLLEAPYADDARLRLIRDGKATGHNDRAIQGVREATGDVFMFLDAHLSFPPFWLSNLYGALERRGFNAIVGPAISPLEEATWLSTSTISYGWTTSRDLAKIGHLGRGQVGPDGWIPWFGATQIMLARETYERLGGFCPLFLKYGTSDREFCMRAFLLGIDCRVEPSTVIGHFYKREFRCAVTWPNVAYAYFLFVWLMFGEEMVGALLGRQKYGVEEGLRELRARRPEVERFRRFIVERCARAAEEYFARAPRLEGAPA